MSQETTEALQEMNQKRKSSVSSLVDAMKIIVETSYENRSPLELPKLSPELMQPLVLRAGDLIQYFHVKISLSFY